MSGPEGSPRPGRVVAIGGGTGMPAVLRGLKRFVGGGDGSSLTAVVAMTDDGGSSGRLRRTMGLPPPGDVRNCLVALAAEEDLFARLFQHRYETGGELGGHTLGNLFLAALVEQTGSFHSAVELSSRVLRTRGRILPATLDDVVLQATLEDGSTITGETRIGSCRERIRRISLSPDSARVTPGVIETILDADLVVLGPGSLYTSVVPNLVVPGVAQALRETRAATVLVGNLVSERGEASGLDLRDHVAVIEAHASGPIVDAVLVHDGPTAEEIQRRYREEGATPLSWPERPGRPVHVVRRNLVAGGPVLRHDPGSTAAGLLQAYRDLTA